MAQPHCPWSNYSKKERTFSLVCEGTFQWLPSSPGVESYSTQLLLHPELTRDRKCPLLGPGVSQSITNTEFLTHFKQKNLTTYFHCNLQCMIEYVVSNTPQEPG